MAMLMYEIFSGGNEPNWQDYVDYRGPYDYAADSDCRSSGPLLPTYEFRVPMCCSKCEEKVREELLELQGVCDIFTDQLSERVAVTDFVNPYHALKKMKRIKKKSNFWDESEPSQRHSHMQNSHKKHKSHGHHSSHTKHHSRQETSYRSNSSQVSYNREPFHSEPFRRELGRSSSFRWPSNRDRYDSASDDDGSYSDLRPSSSSFGCLPRSRSFGHERVPSNSESYYTEDYPESNASYAHY
ncbi:uncharacterized protein [Physcomitrium patens]|uniref:HMA domain-containing protein n=1 Tax=Physcomitrium patens TaxID=3218 RepID=A0A2K1KEE5_PHYPA|nr:heavy metal-associated isoprenylated plant protein 28-like [Physcomitrium patens]PNR52151.1 hypothetical protein PHYPA_008525 [Physcomitrium patens]|eukprot:XP_024377810.1 heavy metal-associated isoprenylated plant protein 28-like [Physcomitrella patens]